MLYNKKSTTTHGYPRAEQCGKSTLMYIKISLIFQVAIQLVCKLANLLFERTCILFFLHPQIISGQLECYERQPIPSRIDRVILTLVLKELFINLPGRSPHYLLFIPTNRYRIAPSCYFYMYKKLFVHRL